MERIYADISSQKIPSVGRRLGTWDFNKGRYAMPVNDSWRFLSYDNIDFVPDRAGVYELADSHWNVIYIGKAGTGRLMQRIREHVEDLQNACIREKARYFRFEVNPNPSVREEELLKEYRERNEGKNPLCNIQKK